ncbi:MAG TPA: helicase-related protein [Stellaceae bacterium]
MSSAPRVTAVLGPTNTGKTHLAIERMLGHQTGMIGFPLRLLARENYDRVAKIKGARRVALITGEEKILPPNPQYFICTVESMPLDRAVEFLAIDEIQLCGDPERGHVFTDRLLHARGTGETMFLGAETIKPLLKRLVPEAQLVSRPRFSTLSYTGEKKLQRLPPRSAVVAFAVAEVFELAEAIRRRRGGTAVVMGALSPRARNAQVGMFQAGEVDYMVATDAIGMGLNMDLDHVAFAKRVKFDGRAPRRLSAPEIAQIAGRAGRHMSDGTFGVTADERPLEPELVEAIEEHRFDPLPRLYWRNAKLDFTSVASLLKSLDAPPRLAGLVGTREADDHQALAALARDAEIAALAPSRDAVRLLWEVCQIPDFRKVMSEQHARLLGQIFRHLRGPSGRLPTDWVASQVSRLDRADGDIDTLMSRIAHIRTWTYIAHRPDWLPDATSWQERARAIEDKLSDALHDRLTQRFVDRHSGILARRRSDPADLLSSVNSAGQVAVEGEPIGRLDGFRFKPDGDLPKALLAAARGALRGEVAARVRRLDAAPDSDFLLAADGALFWRGDALARLAAGESPLEPRIELLPAEHLEGTARETVRHRLGDFVRAEIRRTLAPLFVVEKEWSGAARAILFRLAEGLGVVPAGDATAPLTPDDRKALAKLGVHFGALHLYLPALLKPKQQALRALLWAVAHGASLPELPNGTATPRDPAISAEFYAALGFVILGERVLRVDRVETLAATLKRLGRAGPFAATAELAKLAGARPEELPATLPALGYRAVAGADGAVTFHARPGGPAKRHRPAARRPHRTEIAADNPFAKLKELNLRR